MIDLLLNEDMTLKIDNGDFVLGEATAQNQQQIIVNDKGEFKDKPMRGVGVLRYLEDHTPDRLAREIRQEFTTDGMQVNQIKVDMPKAIEIDAVYIESEQ